MNLLNAGELFAEPGIDGVLVGSFTELVPSAGDKPGTGLKASFVRRMTSKNDFDAANLKSWCARKSKS